MFLGPLLLIGALFCLQEYFYELTFLSVGTLTYLRECYMPEGTLLCLRDVEGGVAIHQQPYHRQPFHQQPTH
jgi:hypothetical protein